MSLISNTTAKLTSAVSSLPQLLERKRLLDMHTTIATGIQYFSSSTACFGEQQHRNNDRYF